MFFDPLVIEEIDVEPQCRLVFRGLTRCCKHGEAYISLFFDKLRVLRDEFHQ